MDDIDLLSSVLKKTGDVIAGVGDEQLGLSTPCPDFDVAMLRNHIVAWLQVFEAGCHGRTFEGDPVKFEVGGEAAAQFRAVSDSIVAGWREHGFDRTVKVMSGELPGRSVFNMTIMEYLTHGWDLAIATNQTVPYTDDEATRTLALAEVTLPDEYCGGAFGPRVEVAAAATGLDQFVAFMGRQPSTRR